MADIAVETPFVELVISGSAPVAAKVAAAERADVSRPDSDCRPVRTFATLELFTSSLEPLIRPEANSSVKAVVVDCGFTSPYRILSRDCKKRHLPAPLLMPLLSGLVRLKMGIDLHRSTEEALARTKIPAFFLHGEADNVVPPEFGRANFAACASPKEAVFVTGATHTVAYPAGGEALQQKLFAFLDRYIREEKENSDETL